MARLFVRLKLRLIANGLRRSPRYAVALVLGAAFVVPFMAAGAVGAALLGRATDPATVAGPALVVALALLWLGWVVGPVLAFAADETLDPARLRLLPLRRSQLAAGLLAASAVGIGPLA
ncbi:MAG: transporter, partial [Actinomycetota bacterium]|nr:transporter [Actinomycetota bacterium]